MSEIQPATDAEIEEARGSLAEFHGADEKILRTIGRVIARILARLDAERARADREVQEKRWIVTERDRTFALMLARAEAAEAKLAKAREALRQAYDDVPGWVDLARAALDDTGGGET